MYTLPNDEEAIMADIYKYGPVQAAFYMYTDFIYYKRGKSSSSVTCVRKYVFIMVSLSFELRTISDLSPPLPYPLSACESTSKI